MRVLAFQQVGVNTVSLGASLHSKVAGRVAVNWKVMFRPDVEPGPEVIVVSNRLASTCHAYVAGVGSTLPAVSLARTENVWSPVRRPA